MVEARFAPPAHGGTDALGIPAHDFSTNRNACGPCPAALEALQGAHVAQYPDPQYTELRGQLAAYHGVGADRIVVGGSSSELIHRLTQHVVRSGLHAVTLPQYHYGDYAQAARVWGALVCPRDSESPARAGLHWACEPSSPLGLVEDAWQSWAALAPPPTAQGRSREWRVLDCAYRPLWLEGEAPLRPLDTVWQVWTPNKALGMTGVRAAYAIAPLQATALDVGELHDLAPSWVAGAHGVAMLQAWTTHDAQHWLAQSLLTLHHWKTLQLALCERLGWQVVPGHQANYFVARLPWPAVAMDQLLHALRAHGIKLRDCASFGLPGHVRLGVLSPASQAALEQAWLAIAEKRHD